jgi:hypothetical protein
MQSILFAILKINSPEVRNFLIKYTQTDPLEESDLRKNYLYSCYEETQKRIKSTVQERKYLGVHIQKKQRKFCYLCLKKRSNMVTEGISIVMPGHIYRELYNNHSFLMKQVL